MSFSNSEKIIRGIAFEKVILEVLKGYNKNLIKEYVVENEKYTKLILDAYCEGELNLFPFKMGFIHGKRIGIEIRAGKQKVSNLFGIIETYQKYLDVFVLILSGNEPSNFKKKLQEHKIDCEVKVLDYNILKKNYDVNKVLTSFDNYIVQENNMLINDNYKVLSNIKENLSFALGAGCSINSNISDWKKLSEALGFELLYNIIDTKDSIYKNMNITNQLNKKIFDCYEKSSALDAIYNCYIKSPTVDQLAYYRAIKAVLYMSYDSPSDANKPLMKSIRECIVRRNIKEIINYNFDSVLEQNYNIKYKSKSSEITSSITNIGECEVHHVHGYIPYDYDGKIAINNFVFTDKEYYDNMIQPKNLSNTTQKRLLQNYNVIFVGVSFTDSNLKAILRERMKNYPQNQIFGFLKLPKFEGNETEKKLLENKYKLIQQSYFDSLGVRILWVNDFDEIPQEINKI